MTGHFKYTATEDPGHVNLRMDRAGLETLRRVVLRASAQRNDDAASFNQRKDTILGTLRAGEALLDG